jgi:enoyl-CoA hydratase/carnithine racemase
LELARKIASRSPHATLLAKRALARAFSPSGADAQDTFLELIEQAFGGPDIREGTRAFFAKEAPEFADREEPESR